MKILVVEDEPKTGSYLKQGLSEAGFTVDLARDGDDAVHLGTTDDYDLIVLDVMLPGRDAGRCCGRCARAARACRCSSSPRATGWRTG